MPTGSLCAERNAMGTALASDPSIRRTDMKVRVIVERQPRLWPHAVSFETVNTPLNVVCCCEPGSGIDTTTNHCHCLTLSPPPSRSLATATAAHSLTDDRHPFTGPFVGRRRRWCRGCRWCRWCRGQLWQPWRPEWTVIAGESRPLIGEVITVIGELRLVAGRPVTRTGRGWEAAQGHRRAERGYGKPGEPRRETPHQTTPRLLRVIRHDGG